MRILRDPSLASYHLKVVGSLMFIFKVCSIKDACIGLSFFSFFPLVFCVALFKKYLGSS